MQQNSTNKSLFSPSIFIFNRISGTKYKFFSKVVFMSKTLMCLESEHPTAQLKYHPIRCLFLMKKSFFESKIPFLMKSDGEVRDVLVFILI
jgi:hypothetical protein